MAIERFEIDAEQWAVVLKREFPLFNDDGLDEESHIGEWAMQQDRKRLHRLIDELIAAAPRPEAGQQTDQWTPSVSNYDRSIHSNPDAKAWADLFVQTFPGLSDKYDLMLGWFANAMMAMHDSMVRRAEPRAVATAIPMSERLPVHTDADYSGLILAFTRFTKEWVLQAWTHVHNCPNAYTHWQRTGLVRPAEPDGGAV